MLTNKYSKINNSGRMSGFLWVKHYRDWCVGVCLDMDREKKSWQCKLKMDLPPPENMSKQIVAKYVAVCGRWEMWVGNSKNGYVTGWVNQSGRVTGFVCMEAM